MTSAQGAGSLSLLVIKVRDIERARTFYELLGLQFTSEKHGSGPEHYAATLRGGTVFEIYPSRREAPEGSVRLGLRVAEPDQAVTRVVAAGLLAASRPARSTPAGTRVIYDPDGNCVELTALAAE